MKYKQTFRWGLGAVLAGGIVGFIVLFPDLEPRLADFLTWTRGLGAWGLVLVGSLYLLTSLLMIPSSPLTLGVGFLFGLVPGTIAVSIGSTLGASLAFITSRFLARGWIEPWATSSARFQHLDEAIAQQGFKIVMLTRLSPLLPFNLLNYLLGLTKVSTRDYILASWLGMLPGTVLYIYLGTAAKNLRNLLNGQWESGPWERGFFFVGLLATLLLTGWITRLATLTLKSSLRET